MPNAELSGLKKIGLNQFYHDYPTVAQLNRGESLVGRSAGCERHVCPFGQAHLIRSSVQLWAIFISLSKTEGAMPR